MIEPYLSDHLCKKKYHFFLASAILDGSRYSKHPKGALRDHFPHSALVRVDAAKSRLGRVLRTAPVSRQTKPKPVCHSPRFHSHPATVTSLRSVPFTVPSVFVGLRAREEQKQAANGRKEKTMKLEEINNRTKDAVSYLVEALESGKSEVLTQYLSAMGRFHSYSFGNIMLIARQKPDATNVARLRTWNSLGRFVKRGEKGILILAPMIGHKIADSIAEATEDAKQSQAQPCGFRAVYVFDISQTEGKDLPTLTEVQGDVSDYRERLVKFVESRGIALTIPKRLRLLKAYPTAGRSPCFPGCS